MASKISEHTYGTHIYMRLLLDDCKIEEIDATITPEGWKYTTTADNMPTGTDHERKKQIIKAFHELY